MRRKTLSSSDLEELLPRLRVFLGALSVKKAVKGGAEAVELTGSRIVVVSGFLFMVTNDAVVPVLVEKNSPL
ncbi:MAG: hypothetical protein RMJ06_06935, partial [Nitrososphaerota archaeon]|nr:hypothetical protein [Nitrososphaerota archaeon]